MAAAESIHLLECPYYELEVTDDEYERRIDRLQENPLRTLQIVVDPVCVSGSSEPRCVACLLARSVCRGLGWLLLSLRNLLQPLRRVRQGALLYHGALA